MLRDSDSDFNITSVYAWFSGYLCQIYSSSTVDIYVEMVLVSSFTVCTTRGFSQKKSCRGVINREIYSYHCFKDLFVNVFQYLLQIISRNIDVRWIYTVSEQLIEKKCVNESYVNLLLKYLNTECTFCKIKKISD